jgi:hypothetical protein
MSTVLWVVAVVAIMGGVSWYAWRWYRAATPTKVMVPIEVVAPKKKATPKKVVGAKKRPGSK